MGVGARGQFEKGTRQVISTQFEDIQRQLNVLRRELRVVVVVMNEILGARPPEITPGENAREDNSAADVPSPMTRKGTPVEEIDGRPALRPDDHDVYEQRYLPFQEYFTQKQWTVICLRHRDGKTQEQIAEELGIKRSAVSQRLTRARKKREALELERGKLLVEFVRNCEGPQ